MSLEQARAHCSGEAGQIGMMARRKGEGREGRGRGDGSYDRSAWGVGHAIGYLSNQRCRVG